MILIGITDIHGDAPAMETISGVLAEADAVLVAGDVTQFGDGKDAARIVDPLRKRASRVLAVPGNCDRPAVGAWLADQGLSLDARVVTEGDVCFAGVGGSLPCPVRTPNEIEEEDFTRALEEAATARPPGLPLVLVSHQPPFGVKNDLAGGSRHVGSRALRSFIERHEPLVCLTGHIHEAVGIDRIGKTVVVNPGPLRGGGFARIEIREDAAEVEIRNRNEAGR